MKNSKRILVVAAHPDDEVLGVGGTIARHAAIGNEVSILIMAEGATSRDDQRNTDARSNDLEALRQAASIAATTLGAMAPQFAGFPDNRMDGVDILDVVKRVEQTVSEFKPDVVYTHFGADLNVDHRIVHEAVLTACRPQPGNSVQEILAFETVSSTEWGSPNDDPFRPQHFVDVSPYMKHKMAALEAYDSEMRNFPHARSRESVEALARVRGASVGVEAAEAFEVIRVIVS